MGKVRTKENVLITGGASGIGKLVALQLAESGHQVIVWDYHQDNLKSLELYSSENHLPLTGYICDVSDRSMVYPLAEEVISRFKTVDILIHCAGVVSGKPLLETPDERIQQTFDVNVLALFWVTKAFLPAMIEQGRGQLVTIASAAGLIGVKGLVDYSASKFAAVGFTESLRMEWAGKKTGIKTTTVCPFFIDTGMFEGVKTRFPLLLPIMKPEKVAFKIVRAILKKKKMLILPPFVRSIFLLRNFPVAFFDAVADFFGINRSMDEFKGRK